jgi:hypothetical protein
MDWISWLGIGTSGSLCYIESNSQKYFQNGILSIMTDYQGIPELHFPERFTSWSGALTWNNVAVLLAERPDRAKDHIKIAH